MKRSGALAELHVVEFGHIMAGPLMTGYLGNFGAQVVKVESHKAPDLSRITSGVCKGGRPGLNRSASFTIANASKLGLSLNLKHPRSREMAHRLVGWADVLVENYAPGALAKWGYGYAELQRIKPDLIMVSATLQGQTGPRAAQPGFGYMLNALAGQVELTGWPDRPGTILPSPWSDFITPWFGVVAIMAALDRRRRTGEGMYIDLSEYECAVAFLPTTVLDYTANGRAQTRQGNASLSAAPHGAYRCRGQDRWCALAVSTEGEWKRFCQVIGNPEWTGDSRFISPSSRLENVHELDRLVEAWTVERTPQEVMSVLQAVSVPAGVVQDCRDIVENDPQVEERAFFHHPDHAEMGPTLHRSPPARFSHTPAQVAAAPCLGEHTEYVCKRLLGMSDAEFQELQEQGVFV